MSWTYLIFHQLHLVPGFSREIFDRPRSELSFCSLTDDAVSFLFTILWDKLYPIANHRKGVQSMLATIPRDEVHSLWKLLKRGFCPQSSMEISERGRRFFDMHQQDESVTNFTTSVLEEKDILGFLNEPKSDADVKAVIIGGLATDDAKAFSFRLVHHSLTDFISEVNTYDMLLSFQRKSRSSSAAVARASHQVSASTDSALATSSTPYSSSHVQCFHCDGFGHIARDCPDSLIPREELHAGSTHELMINPLLRIRIVVAAVAVIPEVDVSLTIVIVDVTGAKDVEDIEVTIITIDHRLMSPRNLMDMRLLLSLMMEGKQPRHIS